VNTGSVHTADDAVENVILISFDSLRSDSITNVNSSDAPTFSLMHDRVTFFKTTIVQAPFTIPSHACMLSGLYPARPGVRDMHPRVSSGKPTALTVLKEHGFATIATSPATLLVNKGFESVDHHIPFSHKRLARAIARPLMASGDKNNSQYDERTN